MKKRLTAMLFMLVMLSAMLPVTAYAAKTISSVQLNCDMEAIKLTPSNTEESVQTLIRDIVQSKTTGVDISIANTFLEYWDDSMNHLSGIGMGTAKVNGNRQYYLDCLLLNGDEYEWPAEVRGLTQDKNIPITAVSTFRVFLNGIRRTDAYLKRRVSGALSVSIPIGRPITAELSEYSYKYNGNAKKPGCKEVQLDSGFFLISSGYKVSYFDEKWNSVTPVNVGKYYAVIQAVKQGIYSGITCEEYKINVAQNPTTVAGKKVKVKASNLQRKKVIVKPTRSFRIKNAKGTLTYKLIKVKKRKFKKYFKVNARNGSIKVRKGLKKGTYKLIINVTSSGNANYLTVTRPVTVTIRVK